VQNIQILDAEVRGHNRTGLLAGSRNYGGTIYRTSVQGKIEASPIVYKFDGFGNTPTEQPQRLGGMVGEEFGNGSAHLQNSADVEIKISSPTDYVSQAEDLSLDVRGFSRVSEIGGYIGKSGEDSTFRFLDVLSSIRVESFSNVRNVGGVVGDGQSPWSGLDVDTSIEIILLEGEEVDRVGAVLGYADEDSASFVSSSSRILIEGATATNNGLALSYFGTGVAVSKVGGVAGEIDQTSQDTFIRSDTDIAIRGVKTIERVAGYVGVYEDGTGFGMGYTDTFVTGSLSLDASDSIRRIGGYANLQSKGQLNGARMFSAVSMETSGTATVEDSTVNPFIGELGTPAIQRPLGAYWDSNLNPSSNPAGHPGAAATTSQLQSRSFLESTGMDFSSVWDIRGGSYPELKVGAYSWGFSGSTPSGQSASTSSSVTTIRPAGPIEIMIPKRAKAGNRVVVTGKRLNRVTDVFLAGKRVTYTLRTNGTLTFKAPKLTPNKYQVRIISETADTVYQRKIRITSR
jgi:hypothetical protein